jgi:hypothetical protein
MTVGADLVLLAAGWGLLRLIWRGRRWPFGVVGAIGLALLAGTAALALATTLLAIAGLPLWLTVPALLGLALAGVPGGCPRLAIGPSAAIAGLVALAIGARLVSAAASSRVLMNDEYAIWALRGRALSLADGLDPDLFANAAAQYQHLDYPLLVPSLVAWSDRWAGSPADGAAHVQVALLCAALLGVVGWAVTRLAGRLAAVCAVVLAVVPVGAAAYSARLYADLPGAAFALATALLVLVWIHEEDPLFLWTAAVTAAGGLLTKNESGLFALGALLAAAIVGRGARPVLAAGAAALSALIPWFAWTRANGLENDVANAGTLEPGRILDNLERLGAIAAGFAEHWPAPWWGLVLLLPAAALAVSAGHRRIVAAVALTLLTALVGLAASYVVTPTEVRRHLDVSAARVLLFPATLTLVSIPLLAGLGGRESRPGR